jgi:WD40 repeat protein
MKIFTPTQIFPLKLLIGITMLTIVAAGLIYHYGYAQPISLRQSVHRHTGSILSAIYSPDGKHIITTSVDKTAQIWNIKTSQYKAILIGHTGSVASAAYSPSSNEIVTASYDNTARIWDAQTGIQKTVLHDTPNGSHMQHIARMAMRLSPRQMTTQHESGMQKLGNKSFC